MTLHLREAFDALFRAGRSDRPATSATTILHGEIGADDAVRLAWPGMMAMGLAHDLGNMLQVASSAVHLLERSVDPASRPGTEPLARAALSSIGRAGDLARQLLELGRYESRRSVRLNPADVLLGISDVLVLAVGSGIEVRSLYGVVPAIYCDAREFENVILNLVVNARDAMGAGGVLTLSTHMERRTGDERGCTPPPIAVVCVRDTGAGIPTEVAKQVFRPLYTTKPFGSGTGLGLAMVQDFARRCGGTVDLESEVGAGTSVTLRLPGVQA